MRDCAPGHAHRLVDSVYIQALCAFRRSGPGCLIDWLFTCVSFGLVAVALAAPVAAVAVAAVGVVVAVVVAVVAVGVVGAVVVASWRPGGRAKSLGNPWRSFWEALGEPLGGSQGAPGSPWGSLGSPLGPLGSLGVPWGSLGRPPRICRNGVFRRGGSA